MKKIQAILALIVMSQTAYTIDIALLSSYKHMINVIEGDIVHPEFSPKESNIFFNFVDHPNLFVTKKSVLEVVNLP